MEQEAGDEPGDAGCSQCGRAQRAHARCDRCGGPLHDGHTYTVIGSASVDYVLDDADPSFVGDPEIFWTICCLSDDELGILVFPPAGA